MAIMLIATLLTLTAAQNECAVDGDCADGLLCVSVNLLGIAVNLCIGGNQCGFLGLCPLGQICAANNICQVPNCGLLAYCNPVDEYCLNSTCQDQPCLSDSDCPAGEVCAPPAVFGGSNTCVEVAEECTGCTTEQECISGECICDDDLCASGFSCDTLTNVCQANTTCGPAPGGPLCQATDVCINNVCEPINCGADLSCSDDEYCNLTGPAPPSCDPQPCLLDTDCLAGNTCVLAVVVAGINTCVPNVVCDPADPLLACPAGTLCQNNICSPINCGAFSCSATEYCDTTSGPAPTCVTEPCLIDTDCASGQTCIVIAGGANVCQANTTCGPAPGGPLCQATDVCINNVCEPINCGADLSCSDDEYCNLTGPAPPSCDPQPCLLDTDCLAGNTCVLAVVVAGINTCVPNVVCDPADPLLACPAGTLCQNNICSPINCGAFSCSATEYCDTTSGPAPTCVTEPCLIDTDCASGQTCIVIAGGANVCQANTTCGPAPGGPLCQATDVCINNVCEPINCGADLSCSDDEYCNLTGPAPPSCDPQPCLLDTDCLAGNTCVLAVVVAGINTCVPNVVCDPADPLLACPAGTLCQNNICSPINCGAFSCSATEYCDTTSGPAPTCVTEPCLIDTDCASGQTCIVIAGGANVCQANTTCGPAPGGPLCQATDVCINNVCEPINCGADLSCSDDEYCNLTGPAPPSCDPQPCLLDTDCPSGNNCVISTTDGANVCEPNVVCGPPGGEICQVGETCVENTCQPINCGTNLFCNGLQYCDDVTNPATPVCVEQPCLLDEECDYGFHCTISTTDGANVCEPNTACDIANSIFCPLGQSCIGSVCTISPTCGGVVCTASQYCDTITNPVNPACVNQECLTDADCTIFGYHCEVSTTAPNACVPNAVCGLNLPCPGLQVCVGGQCLLPNCGTDLYCMPPTQYCDTDPIPVCINQPCLIDSNCLPSFHCTISALDGPNVCEPNTTCDLAIGILCPTGQQCINSLCQPTQSTFSSSSVSRINISNVRARQGDIIIDIGPIRRRGLDL